MPLTRVVSTGLLAALLGVSCGCAPTPPSGSGTGKGGGESPAKTEAFVGKARQFAADFLKAVKAGKADTAQLSEPFKKVYAPDSTKPTGFSDNEAGLLLKLAATEVGEDLSIVGTDGKVALLVARGKAGERTLVRVVDDGGMKIDWLGVSPKNLPGEMIKGEHTAVQFAAMSFADAILTRKFQMAEAVLTDAAKAALGKSVLDGKFNPGALKNKFEELLGGATQYTITGAIKETVTLEVPYGGSKKTVSMKLAAGRSPADFKVDQIEVK
jgi:hypothetical protein